jgi:hypothetical protein
VGEVDEGHTSDTGQEMTIFQKSHVERAFHDFIYIHRTKSSEVTEISDFSVALPDCYEAGSCNPSLSARPRDMNDYVSWRLCRKVRLETD